ncbi:hypothetical protein CsatB_029045 [Cannabis sativa]
MAVEYSVHEYYNSDDDNGDALSFCDLPVLDKDDTELDPFLHSNQRSCTSSPENHDHHDDDLFEFSVSPETKDDESVIFCGVPIIPPKKAEHNNNNKITINNNSTSSRHTRSGRFIRRSEKLSSDGVVSNRASSFRFGNGTNKRPSNNNNNNNLAGIGSFRCRGEGAGGFRRKHNKVIMGLVRFQAAPKMELSEMRRRQSRRSPVPMFPVENGSGEPTGTGGSHWGLFRPLRCRAHFVSAWNKASFRCL